jgi:hypothetical protein
VSAKDRRDRLDKLEGKRNLTEQERDEEHRRAEIRRAAEHANRCQPPGEEPLFVVMPSKDVFCALDGRPVTTTLQITCEAFYLKELERGGPGLVYDPGAESFYTLDGELALSRDFVHLERLIGDARLEAWESESA